VTTFQYDAAVVEQFPNVVGGVIIGHRLQNGASQSALQDAFLTEQRAVIERIGSASLSELPSLQAWRRAFTQFGVQPTKYRSAAESLLRRLTKKGDIPSINRLVDIGNLVSIRYGLPIAVVDSCAIQGTLTVHFADGSEHYTELNADEVLHPEPGEVVFTDETKTVFARRWCWRQSAQSAAQDQTTDVIITIEAQHEDGQVAVEPACSDMLELLRMYAGGDYEHAILDRNNPAI
jgi:DNA/RNA-binding domain of Phe-tRNA-synthetase-like protein